MNQSKKPQILIVEDEFITRADLRDKLIRLGYDVTGLTDSGEEAIRLAGDLLPDIILMDISLSGKITGIEAANQIHTFCDVPIIYLTAHSDDETFVKIKESGPFGYLVKPYDERILQILLEITLIRHALECRLKENEERYRSIAELSDERVCIFNENLTIAYGNPSIAKFLSVSSEYLIGKRLDEFLPSDVATRVEALLNDIFSNGIRCRKTEDFTISEDKIWLDMTFIPINPGPGDNSQVIWISRDITIQVNTKKELDRRVSEQTCQIQFLLNVKDEFIRHIGHDLKTPLTPLIAMMPYLLKSESDPKKCEILTALDENVKTLKTQVHSLITLSEKNSALIRYDVVEISITPVIRKVIQKWLPRAREKGIVIIDELPEILNMRMSAEQGETIFGNLIDNGVKFTNSGGTVRITASKTDEWVVITVADTGIGLDLHEIERIFEPLYKADTSRHDIRSTGIGLTWAKKLVHNLGGIIEVMSEGKGKGTVFTVRFPVVCE